MPKITPKKKPLKKPIKKQVIKKPKVVKRAPIKKVALKKPAKRATVPKLNALMILDEVEKNKDFVVICFYRDSLLIARRVKLSVNRINENSIFQPHEHVEKKVYCALALLEFTPTPFDKDMPWRDWEELKRLECPVRTIKSVADVEWVLEGLHQ